MTPTKILSDTPPDRVLRYANGIESASITRIESG